MRAAIYQLVTLDPELNAYGINDQTTFTTNATDTPPRNGPFLTINISDGPKAFGKTGAKEVTIWAHMPKELTRDYGMIDMILLRCKEIMANVTQEDGADGWTLTAATWRGDSGDLFDDGYSSLARNSTFRVASRYSGVAVIR